VKRRQGRRRKQVLNNLKETKGNWRLKKVGTWHSLSKWLWTLGKSGYRLI